MSLSRGDDNAVVLQIVMERQAEHDGRGRFEIVEELGLKAVKNADEKVLTFDRFSRAVVKGYDHRGFVGGDGRRAGCGLPRLFGHHTSSHKERRTSGRRVRAVPLTICWGRYATGVAQKGKRAEFSPEGLRVSTSGGIDGP